MAVLGPQRVDVDGTVGRLCGYVFVQRIPGHALDVVIVLGDLPYQRACGRWCYPSVLARPPALILSGWGCSPYQLQHCRL